MTKNIILIGMSGVGKSTIGKQLSKKLKKSFIDLDSVICDKYHLSLPEIIAKLGKNAFLNLEEETCLELNFDNLVCAPGGSLIYSDKAMHYCKENAIVIYLKDSLENLKTRVINWESRGIIGLNSDTYEGVFNERQALYQNYADITIACNHRSWTEISADIIEQLNRYSS